MNHAEQEALAPERDARMQFRLRRMQLFNWGTFSDVVDIDISPEGYLFVGPSGSGKTTILDANAALLTPPRWVDYNVAAREAERGGRRDRNVLTYVRGAWGEQTEQSGEVAAQYLRMGSTWSAVAQQYRDGYGKTVSLVHLLWVRGNTTAASDVKHLYLVLEREFDVRELQFFAQADFDVRSLKTHLPDALATDEFTRYQERFRRLMGIDSARALRLLHKTQSAKNMGDLNEFLRDYMLDEPETFDVARRLVEQFGELNDAWRAVRDARRQVETLEPAAAAHAERDGLQGRCNELNELHANLERYCEQRREALLRDAVALGAAELEAARQEQADCERREREAQAVLSDLESQRRGEGGRLLEELTHTLREAEAQRESRHERFEQVRANCRVLQWSVPASAQAFSQQREAAARLLQSAQDERGARRTQRDETRDALKAAETQFTELNREIVAMQRQRSNLDDRFLQMRALLAQQLGVPETELPFVAELVEVKPEEARWQGPVERVLAGFARSVLVSDERYAAVTAAVNATHLRGRLVYHRMLPHAPNSQPIAPTSVYRKLNFAQTPAAHWVREELKARFEYVCTETLEEFRAARKAVTLAGQIKHGGSRHEKDDRFDVNDRGHWVLGFDNAAKRALYEEQAHACVARIEAAKQRLDELESSDEAERERLFAANFIGNLQWDDIDVGASLQAVDALQKRIAVERAARPELAELDAHIERQAQAHAGAREALVGRMAEVRTRQKKLEELEEARAGLREELLRVALTPFAQAGLAERFDALGTLTFSTLDARARYIERGLNEELGKLREKMGKLEQAIVLQFHSFIGTWPAESQGLDATLASAADFFAKLERLKADGLPQYEARFRKLLHDQNDQNLTRLQSQLDQERLAIRRRMEVVNEALGTTAYSPGTHLTIETRDLQLAEVIAFRQSMRQTLAHALGDDAREAEARFKVLHDLVKRLASQDPVDVKWRALVLDVRQHVEFRARELYDVDGTEAEVLRSGSGKSGGQRQKLAAACLAAALSYQLGGRENVLPRFCAVVMDEAFDKSDSDFTRIAMDVFKTFGFQMIVATPLKSVMTLEPYIGGACFVHNTDRKTSRILPIAYDHATRRLMLTAEQTHDVDEAARA